MSILLRALAVLFACFAVAASAKYAASGQFEIVTLSNRADLISGGDALVEVRVPDTVPLQHVTLWLNGTNVAAAFHTDAAARVMRGVLTGLVVGENTFLANSNGGGKGRPRASLTITNHPIGGPVCWARRRRPGSARPPRRSPNWATRRLERERFVNVRDRFSMQHCDRIQAVLPDDHGGLLDSVARPESAGRTSDEQLLQAVHPGKHADRSRDDHHDRRSDGAIHRARGARNDQPRDLRHRGSVRPDQPWSALAPQAQWNGKVVYTFGASTGQPRQQFRTEQNWADHSALSRGFMVSTTALPIRFTTRIGSWSPRP